MLKAACEGRLVPTEAELARAEGRAYESGAELLARILAEPSSGDRRVRRVRVGGRQPSLWDADADGNHEQAPAVTGDADLPEGWCWTALKRIAEVRLGRQRSPNRHVGPNMRPYLRAANVTWDGLDLSDVYEMDFSPEEQDIYRLRSGDIVLSEASGSASEVGKPALWSDEIPNCCFQNTLLRVRSRPELAGYLLLHFQADARLGRFGNRARGVGIHHLGAEGLSNWMIALPPLAEQQRIVAEVERRLSAVERLEGAVEAGLRRAERLRQAILKRAFAGRLVPQDPADEPASALLERIRAARNGATATQPASGRRVRRATRDGAQLGLL